MMRHWVIGLLLAAAQTVWAQQKQPAYMAYIERYAPMAVEQMKLHNIPASITLAQGLHESGAGRSRLATEANNHFGIKVGSSWDGPYIVQSDDHPFDRFRVYGSARESYEDHSLFLKKKRYESLFQLASTDYKGWAHGLKRCGYATNPAYAQNLIKLIEDYNLYDYDTSHKKRKDNTTHLRVSQTEALAAMGIGRCNDNYYITVAHGESLASIAERTNVSPTRLIKYNELRNGYVLTVGDRIYLKKKRSRAERDLKGYTHTVKEGESMHSISQIYGIRMAGLYKTNRLPSNYVPRPGDQLRVR